MVYDTLESYLECWYSIRCSTIACTRYDSSRVRKCKPNRAVHVGHGRGAAYGSALVNLLRAAGFNVQSEYYINDAGNQIDNMAISIE